MKPAMRSVAIAVAVFWAAIAWGADRIIVLSTGPADPGNLTITAVYWFPAPEGEERPLASGLSAYAGASETEKADLQTGRIVEEVRTTVAPEADPRPALETEWNNRKAERDAAPAAGKHYGRAWDGKTWRKR